MARLSEYAMGFATEAGSLLREATKGSVGRWRLVEGMAWDMRGGLVCDACGERRTVREGRLIGVRCRCDFAAAERAWHAYFGALVDLPDEAVCA